MEDYFSIKLLDSEETIPFVLTYAIHKDLQPYLSEESRLFNLFTDVEIADNVITMCLSTRNDHGQIVKEFTLHNKLDAGDAVVLLDFVFDYFSKFFLTHQQLVQETLKNLETQAQPQ